MPHAVQNHGKDVTRDQVHGNNSGVKSEGAGELPKEALLLIGDVSEKMDPSEL